MLQANLDEKQVGSSAFVRALMIAVCQAAVICESLPYTHHSQSDTDMPHDSQKLTALGKHLQTDPCLPEVLRRRLAALTDSGRSLFSTYRELHGDLASRWNVPTESCKFSRCQRTRVLAAIQGIWTRLRISQHIHPLANQKLYSRIQH